MIFIWLGKVMSYLMLAGSMFKISFGFYFAITAQDHVAAAQKYLGASTTGEAINQAFVGLGFFGAGKRSPAYDFVACCRGPAVVAHVPTGYFPLHVVSADVADGNELFACAVITDRNGFWIIVQLLTKHLHHFVGCRCFVWA
ncbi:hypothetical protein [Phaeobacter inhibens]|uniref:hypothetical protein n=1 Tax=Phaeobacter inhibens TaxID=221822 RepID=UPI000F4B89B0|nr:hypothetical protein [Phaeobacter inhibens]